MLRKKVVNLNQIKKKLKCGKRGKTTLNVNKCKLIQHFPDFPDFPFVFQRKSQSELKNHILPSK